MRLMKRKITLMAVGMILLLCIGGIGNADLVDISVATDKTTYLVGEEVNVYVSAYNPSEDPITLSFVSSLQSTYWMDASYYWHENKIFSPSSSYVVINPNSTFTWERIHGINELLEYPLVVGEHNVVGHIYALELQDNYFTETIYFDVIPEPCTIIMITIGSLCVLRRPRNRFSYLQ